MTKPARIPRVHTRALCPILLLLALSCIPCASVSAAQQQQTASPAPDYSARASEVVANLAARQFDKVFAQFDATMAAGIPADKLAQIWDQVLAQSGAFQKINSSQEVRSNMDRKSRVVVLVVAAILGIATASTLLRRLVT